MIRDQRIILVGGPGGVGKTTMAAALGVALAKKGYRTLVLTVDPARRLAQALGLKSFSQETEKVELGEGLRLDATMLDTQRYFDRVIEKFAKSEVQKRKILENPIYRTMVENLGGTHEYAAMERLYELSLNADYDRIIVDTPPMQNAIDLLKAPERLAAFMDNSVLRWFQNSPSLSKRLFQTTSKIAMKLMRTIFGEEFLSSFEQLMTDFEGLQYGFQERHRAVERLLKDPKTAFLLVTYPSAERFTETKLFLQELKTQEIALQGIVLNRVDPALPEEPLPHTAGATPALEAWLNYHRACVENQKQWSEGFEKEAQGVALRIIERSAESPHSLDALSRLGGLLLS